VSIDFLIVAPRQPNHSPSCSVHGDHRLVSHIQWTVLEIFLNTSLLLAVISLCRYSKWYKVARCLSHPIPQKQYVTEKSEYKKYSLHETSLVKFFLFSTSDTMKPNRLKHKEFLWENNPITVLGKYTFFCSTNSSLGDNWSKHLDGTWLKASCAYSLSSRSLSDKENFRACVK
jgi:hypothetical protein